MGRNRLQHSNAVPADWQMRSATEHQQSVRTPVVGEGRIHRHIPHLYDASRACNAATGYGTGAAVGLQMSYREGNRVDL